ncbi:MAG: hypothetical protein O3B01_06030 [Planctomycetota bacterium]|nr:hypothetical protein [Planctomycetota bacterium]MDA1138122.1 hypothetical protein [Planctomycetota bacterium]
MTQLLVSVKNVEEVQRAVRGGASILDIKEPNNGPLGRPLDSVIKEILRSNSNKVAVSVALGELVDCHPLASVSWMKVKFYKLGLSQSKGMVGLGERTELTRKALGILKEQFIVVAYADSERSHCIPPEDVTSIATEFGWKGILIDTWCKDGTCLFDWMSVQRLRDLNQVAGHGGLSVGLAGSLKSSDISKALKTGAEILGIRGLVCIDGKRANSIVAERVRLVRIELDRAEANRC